MPFDEGDESFINVKIFNSSQRFAFRWLSEDFRDHQKTFELCHQEASGWPSHEGDVQSRCWFQAGDRLWCSGELMDLLCCFDDKSFTNLLYSYLSQEAHYKAAVELIGGRRDFLVED